jgi:predicted adenine nucleotide alpha hydrolase (AANH) superfamily ATPase
MRLQETVSFAKQNGFEAFTTTLLGSPYQDHGVIKEICEGLSRASGVKFYYKDFRLGFRDAHESAREKGMYCQKYCGCAFSLAEREEAEKFRK